MKHVITITVEQTVIGAPPTMQVDHPQELPPLQGLSMCVGATQYFIQAEANLRLAQQAMKEAAANGSHLVHPNGRPISQA